VTRAIDSVAQVQHTEVSFSLKQAYVDSNSCRREVFEAIRDALTAEGYGGTVIATEMVGKEPTPE
jgi:hypothetical protein